VPVYLGETMKKCDDCGGERIAQVGAKCSDMYTDLTRPSYSLEKIEKAVADVVVTQGRRAKTARASSRTVNGRGVTTPLANWQQRMVDFAVAHDSNFKALRDGARIGRFGKLPDRSRIEFLYTYRLLEMVSRAGGVGGDQRLREGQRGRSPIRRFHDSGGGCTGWRSSRRTGRCSPSWSLCTGEPASR